jgi:predicted acylesterase/phospholipase RssA
MSFKFKYSSHMVSSRHRPGDRILVGPKKKIALVCSGGGSKAGAFHLGVALALQEQGFRFYGGMVPQNATIRPPEPMEISTYVGSSAGSIISTYLAAGYSLENIFNSFLARDPDQAEPQTERKLPRLTYQKMFKLRPGLAREQIGQISLFRRIFMGLLEGNFDAFLQLKWIRATGIFSTAGIEQYLREEVLESNRFQDYMAELFIIATQLNHSRKVVFGKYGYEPPPFDLTCQYVNDVGISEACASSSAIPVIYAPYAIEHQDSHVHHYFDGEIRDTLSTHVAIDAGADLVIASYTHQPYHLVRDIGSLTEQGLPSIVIQALYLVIEQKIRQHVVGRQQQRSAILAVQKYCQENGVSDVHRRKITEILEGELHHRLNVDTIYIHPNATDTQMFFGEHFTLSPTKLSDMVKSGFRAAIETLRKYDFADRKPEPAMGSASI